MSALSKDARVLLRHLVQALQQRTNAWCDAPVEAATAAAELETHGYIARYSAGWRLTNEGLDHLLTTRTPAWDEVNAALEYAKGGLHPDAIRELMATHEELSRPQDPTATAPRPKRP